MGCASLGGYVYRGCEFPALYGLYIFADYCSGRFWSIKNHNGSWQTTQLLDATNFNFSTFGEDVNGELFVAGLAEGIIYKVRDANNINANCPCEKQMISLTEGWNIISAYIIPDSPALERIFEEIENKIVIVKNNSGHTYIPSHGINTIGSWDVTQGYQVKTLEATILNIGCEKVSETTNILLAKGWNMMSFLKPFPMNIQAAFSAIESDIIIVKNDNGDTYIPSMNINTIGNLQPGQGYQIKMSNARTFAYP